MYKKYVALLALVLCFNTFAQSSLWTKITTKHQISLNSEIPPESIQFQLQKDALLNSLSKAPSRLALQNSNVLIDLPNEEGGFDSYQVFEASNLHPDLAAKFPEIKSYVAKGVTVNATARISYAPSLGFSIAISNFNSATVLVKSVNKTHAVYSVFSRASILDEVSDFECETIETAKNAFQQNTNFNKNADDSNLRLYRAAITTTGEFSQFYLDGTETTDAERKAKVIAALNLSLTRINGIFERDFSVTMQLVPNNDALIYLNAATDPFNVDNFTVQNTIDNVIGDANYDVGHLYAYQGSIFGNAGCIACVCTPGSKGQAYTVHSAPDSDHFNMIASHEFGHQFGGWHVQSSANCRSAAGLQEVEPGSGSTIMGYAGICSPNVQNGPDDYFNYVDIRDVAQWTINDSSCAQLISLSNDAPTANAGDNYTIPRSTAFILEGQGSDTNSDVLSFCWEENDPENPSSTQTPQPTWVVGPMFRSKLPVATPDRYMPQLSDVVNGNLTPTWEMLPSVSRTMDFVLTVRDNALNGGQTASDEMTVTVTDTAGPFVVTSQSTSESWNVGENTIVTWDVANTNIAPVNASQVDIYLSIDGGFTYPYPLAMGVTNDGSETINIPNVPTTTQARVMVRGTNSIFFAINATNFEVQASEFVMNFVDANLAVCKPDDAVYNFTYNTFLGFNETTTFSAVNLPANAIATFNPPNATNDNTNVVLTISNTNAVVNGIYDITINGNSNTADKNTTISLEVYDANLLAPTLLFPENNATSVDISEVFTWENDDNAANYEIQVASDVSFNTIVVMETTEDNFYNVSNLEYNTTYYWRVRTSNVCGTSGYSTINEFITFCVAPSTVFINNILTDSASVNWTENGNATSWEVEVVETGVAPTGIGMVTATNPYAITGLNSSTTYDVYVRSICGGGNYSDWTTIESFTTGADFCNGDHFYDTGGPGGNYSDGEFITTLIAPSAGNNNVSVEFNSFQLESCCDALSVYDGPDTSAPFLGQYSGTTIPGPFTSTHPSGTLTFLFTSDGSVTGTGWDATVTCQFVSCPDPADLTVTNVSLSSADLSWLASGNETSWELEYGLSGFTQGTGTLQQTSTNPYQLSALDLETSYDVYLRGNCGANPGEDDSNWVGPLTFSTLGLESPGSLTAELTDSDQGLVTLNWGEPSDFVGSWLIFYDFDCIENWQQAEFIFNGDNTFSVPEFDLFGTYTLTGDQIVFTFDNGFSYFGTRTGDFMEGSNDSGGCWYGTKLNNNEPIEYTIGALDVLGQPTSNPNQLATTTSTSLAFLEYNVYRDTQLITTTTETTYLDTLPDFGVYQYYVTAVYDEGESGSSNIETVEWISCPEPSNLAATNITASSTDLSWISDGTETSWQLEYGASGFTLGTGTMLQVATNPYTLTGLDVFTGYDVYVRANCGANPGEDDSSWIGPVAFTTLDLDGPGILTAELTDQVQGEVTLVWGGSNFVGSWLLSFDHDCSDNYNQVEIIFYDDGTFEIPSESNTGTWVIVDGQITWTYPDGFQYNGTVTGNFMEGTMDSGGCWFADKISGNNYIEYVIGDVTSTGVVAANAGHELTITPIALDFIEYNVYRNNQLIASTIETTYIDTLPNYGIYQYYVAAVFDEGESEPSNTEIVEWISCPEPTNLAAINTTASSTDLSWVNGESETSWELEYGLAGFAQGTGTVLQVSTNPYVLSGLDSSSNYEVYVRANCGANPGVDDSNWVGPVAFTTLADYCNGDHFYDSGGANGNYQNGEDITTVISPSAGFNSVTVAFNTFQLESCCDYLSVYDGLDINAPFLGQYNGTTIPSSFTSNNPSGALTFRFTSDGSVTGSGWDATVICESITCPNPSDLQANNITANAVDLSWVVGNSETSWELEYGLAGFTQGTGTVLQVSSNPYVLSGLDSGASYEVYVRANCGANPGIDDSSWVGPVAFTTLADFCNGDHFYDSGGVNGNYQNGEDITTVISPSAGFNVVTVAFNSFQLESCCDYLSVYDGLDINAPFIGQYNGTTIPSSFTANNPSGALTFRFTSDGSVTGSGWDATVTCESISCPDPTDLVSANVTQSTVDLSWIAGGTETSWEIEYGFTGFTPGTGTVLQVATNPYTLTGLDTLTEYEVYVRSNCGANPGEDDSNWVGPVAFTTLDLVGPGILTAELTDQEQGEVTLNWGTSNFVGSWLLSFDHGCNNNFGQVEIIFYEDGTFNIPSENNTGTWVIVDNQITWTYVDGFQYNGTVTGDYMEGTMDSGGCWFADKISGNNYIDYVIGELTSTGLAATNAGNEITITPISLDFIEYNVYRDNQLIASTIETTYLDTLPGYGIYEYYVAAVYDEGESDPSNIEIVEWESLGIESNTFEGLNIYPNPVNTMLNIKYSQNMTKVELFSVLGQKVMSLDIETSNTSVDMSVLEAGTYFVKVWVNERSNVYKIVKE